MGSIFSVSENLTAIHGRFPALVTSQIVQEPFPSQSRSSKRDDDPGFSDNAAAENAAAENAAVKDWGDMVLRIREGVPSGMEDLYGIFGKGVRWMILRQLGPEELDDKVHDCFIIVAQSIQNGDIREPERLMGYVRTIVKRQIATHIETKMYRRHTEADFEDAAPSISDYSDDPEKALWERQRADIARRVLQGISKRDREILNRFYVLEQTQDQICSDMKLSYNQFRLLKSRAKQRFGEMGKRLALGVGRRLGPK